MKKYMAFGISALLMAGLQAQATMIAQFSGNITTTATGQVSAWINDVSGGSDAVNPTASMQPYAATEIIGEQAVSVVDFGANTNRATVLYMGSQSSMDSRPVGFCAVFKHTCSTEIQTVMMLDDASHAYAYQGWISSGGTFGSAGRNASGTMVNAASPVSVPADDKWYVMFGALSANNFVRLRIVELDDQNDSSMLYRAASGADMSFTGNEGVYIGNNTFRLNSFLGKMAEMRIYNNDLELSNTVDGPWMAELDDLRSTYFPPDGMIARFSSNITTTETGQVSAWVNDVFGGSDAVNSSPTFQPYVATEMIGEQSFNVIDFGANTNRAAALMMGAQSTLDSRPIGFSIVFKHTSSTELQNLICVDDASHDYSHVGWMNSDGTFRSGGRNASGTLINAVSPSALPADNKWYVMLGVLSDNDYVRLRLVELDDEDNSSMQYSAASGADMGLSGNEGIYIGNNRWRQASFIGQMAEMRIYNMDLELFNSTDGAWMTELENIRTTFFTIPAPIPSFVSLAEASGAITIAASNLSVFSSVTNTLQTTTNLPSGIWDDLYTVIGVAETNWTVPTGPAQSFYRIQTTY